VLVIVGLGARVAVTTSQIMPTKVPWHTTTDSRVGVAVGVSVGTRVAVTGALVAVGKTTPPIPLPVAVVGVLLGLIGAGVVVAVCVATCVAAWVAVLEAGTVGVDTLTFWNVAVGVTVAITNGVPA